SAVTPRLTSHPPKSLPLGTALEIPIYSSFAFHVKFLPFAAKFDIKGAATLRCTASCHSSNNNLASCVADGNSTIPRSFTSKHEVHPVPDVLIEIVFPLQLTESWTPLARISAFT